MGGAAAGTLIGEGVGVLPTETISRESGARRFSRLVLCLYFALSIFEPYLNGIFGSLTKYYIFFVIIVLVYESRGTIWVRRYSAFYVVWFLYKVFSLLWSRSFATPKLHIISQIGMVLFLAAGAAHTGSDDSIVTIPMHQGYIAAVMYLLNAVWHFIAMHYEGGAGSEEADA